MTEKSNGVMVTKKNCNKKKERVGDKWKMKREISNIKKASFVNIKMYQSSLLQQELDGV